MVASLVRRLIVDEHATTAVEYAVLLALILIVVIGAVTSVGNSTSGAWQDNVSRIGSATGGS
jgi:Flp pilus assembly pilin Flp